jgi:hypothetical protein
MRRHGARITPGRKEITHNKITPGNDFGMSGSKERL